MLSYFFKKIGPTPASFLFIFGLFKQTIQFLQHMNVKNVMSIQYPALSYSSSIFCYFFVGLAISRCLSTAPRPMRGKVAVYFLYITL